MGMRNERVRIKRAYEEPAPEDGVRVLVDRLWPRGLAKERARIDLWLKDVAPSAELRRWYGHDPERFAEFQSRYTAELAREPARTALETLRDLARRGPVTLVFAAKDRARSNAAVLQDLLDA
ncbi:MAG TPA: DUF488 domain-containing protein [Ktedonobacterales bacterium]|nr:DUF488 domain-containing protein [Ktedonobacterales bacterium]